MQGVSDPEHAVYVLVFCALLGALLGSNRSGLRARVLAFLMGGAVSGLVCFLLLGSPAPTLVATGLGGSLGLVGPALAGGGLRRRHPGGFGHGPFAGAGSATGFSRARGPSGGAAARGRW